MKLYRDVLQSAWHHTIQRPGLWVFGFFATFVFGASGELDRYLRFMNAVVSEGHLLNVQSWSNGHWFVVMAEVCAQLLAGNASMWLLVLGCGFAGLVLVVMMSISVGALIHSAKHNTESFTEAFTAGRAHWLQLVVLFVGAYLGVIVGTLAVTTAIVYLMSASSFEATQLTILLVSGVIFVPLVIIVSFWMRLTAMAIVIDNVHLGTGAKRAWTLLTQHWLVVLEMAIVSFVVVTVVNMLLLLGLILIFLPFFVSISVGGGTVTLLRLQTALFYGHWLYLLLSLFSAALLSTWQWSAWTNLFETLRTGKPTSSLVGLIRGVK